MPAFRTVAAREHKSPGAKTSRIRTPLIENNKDFRTKLRENETTLFENRPRTALDHITENSKSGVRLPRKRGKNAEPGQEYYRLFSVYI